MHKRGGWPSRNPSGLVRATDLPPDGGRRPDAPRDALARNARALPTLSPTHRPPTRGPRLAVPEHSRSPAEAGPIASRALALAWPRPGGLPQRRGARRGAARAAPRPSGRGTRRPPRARRRPPRTRAPPGRASRGHALPSSRCRWTVSRRSRPPRPAARRARSRVAAEFTSVTIPRARPPRGRLRRGARTRRAPAAAGFAPVVVTSFARSGS